MAGRMGAQLMAIVTEGENGRSYYSPDSSQVNISLKAEPAWVPQGELAYEPRAMWCKLYGLVDFADLFTPRQLTALTTFSDLVGAAREQIRVDGIAAGLPDDDVPLRDGGVGARAYAEAVSVYLTFGVGRIANTLTTIARWTSSREQTVTAFARQALPMTWDYPDVNPFSGAAGDIVVSLDTIANALEKLPSRGVGEGDLGNASTIELDGRMMVSTDPPYYDNIGYADLSDYFYIWMRHSLSSVYPGIFATMLVPKDEELIASPYRFDGDTDQATDHFETGLKNVFDSMQININERFPLTVYYAFKQEEIVPEEGVASTGWEVMLSSLVNSGFSIVGTWPMRTELSNRMIASGTNALASSIVLVCRSRESNAPVTSRREFMNMLKVELPPALEEMLTASIAPVDLAQASIGPGMAVYSRYSKVLEANGERLTVRSALQLINQVLDEYLAEQEGELDSDSRFAVAWFEQFGFEEGDFGTADVLARAKNTSVQGLERAGVLVAPAGKVRLLRWSELDEDWNPSEDERLTVWETAHHLIQGLNAEGEEGAAALLSALFSDLAADTRQLAYRLYSICERKGWADLARDYNMLVTSWGASQERASEIRETVQQSRMF